jgi:hypothetical protein
VEQGTGLLSGQKELRIINLHKGNPAVPMRESTLFSAAVQATPKECCANHIKCLKNSEKFSKIYA